MRSVASVSLKDNAARFSDLTEVNKKCEEANVDSNAKWTVSDRLISNLQNNKANAVPSVWAQGYYKYRNFTKANRLTRFCEEFPYLE